jgi:phosphoribosylamine--glycine ligase
VLPLLATPLGGLLHAAATGTLADHPALQWTGESAVTVVMASAGYPASARAGDVVSGTDATAGVSHAGTSRDADGRLVTAGGRVLSVTATGPDLAAARDAAYRGIAGVSFDGAQYRTDIAAAALEGRIQLAG